MKQLWSLVAVYLLTATQGTTIASAGGLDHQKQPPPGTPFVTPSGPAFHPSSQPVLSQNAKQQASLKTVMKLSEAGPQRYLFTYYPDGSVESQRLQCHKTGIWNDSLRTTWTYTAAGKLKSEYVEQYLQGAYRALRRWTLAYNDAGDAISSLTEEGAWSLEPKSRTLYTYASPGKAQSSTLQTWSGGWSNAWRSSFSWNVHGDVIGEVREQWIAGGWDTTSVTVSTYSGSSVIEEIHRTRYRSGSVWGDSAITRLRRDDAQHVFSSEMEYWRNGVLSTKDRATNLFDGDMRIVRTTAEELMQGTITPTGRVTFTYDYLGHELKRVRELYGGGAWQPEWQLTSGYDGSGNILSVRVEEWGGAAWIPLHGTSLNDGYSSVLVSDAAGNRTDFHQFITLDFAYGAVAAEVPGGSAEQPRTWELMQNYPNPFNPSTTIRYGLPMQANVILSVYDALGREVALLENGVRSAGYHEVRFDGAGLPSGVYIYRLRSGNFSETKKFVMVR